jgi:hypothetical protein
MNRRCRIAFVSCGKPGRRKRRRIDVEGIFTLADAVRMSASREVYGKS